MGHQVDVLTMAYRGLPWHENVDGIDVYRIPCIRFKRSVCYTPEMATYVIMAIPVALKRISFEKYHINHSHFIFPDGVIAYCARILTGLPYFITAHGSDVPQYNPNRFKLEHKMLAPLWQKVSRGAQKIICPSEVLQSLIRKHAPQLSTALIPNGINLEKFSPHRQKQDRVLVVTRMFERKGVQYLLRAIKNLPIDYEIHLVGDGPYLKTLKGMIAHKHPDITWWGFLDNQSQEIRELYETSRIFVFPSESENFPIVLLEAMAAGMAIITTEKTGCAEVVGDTGILVRKRDSDAIREALVALVNDRALCARLGKAARKRLEDNFSWRSVARQYLRTFLKAF